MKNEWLDLKRRMTDAGHSILQIDHLMLLIKAYAIDPYWQQWLQNKVAYMY